MRAEKQVDPVTAHRLGGKCSDPKCGLCRAETIQGEVTCTACEHTTDDVVRSYTGSKYCPGCIDQYIARVHAAYGVTVSDVVAASLLDKERMFSSVADTDKAREWFRYQEEIQRRAGASFVPFTWAIPLFFAVPCEADDSAAQRQHERDHGWGADVGTQGDLPGRFAMGYARPEEL